jgi:hypothetical protein
MSEMEAQQQQARLLIGRMYPTRRASPPSRRVRRAPVRIVPVAPVAFALAGPPAGVAARTSQCFASLGAGVSRSAR